MRKAFYYFTLSLLFCIALLASAAYLQFVLNLAPCPLCIIQRIWIVLLAVLCLMALLHRPRYLGTRMYASAQMILSGLGMFSAGRQIWLQHLPAGQAPACAPDLTFMINNLPLGETVKLLFSGDGECAKVAWTFLGLSTPNWTLLAFAGLLLLGAMAFYRAK